ncbi:hypothetical protein KUTeg_004789 [Tegillarca granosa]|uniref:Uncharacterized protein n=1 Tax=Tegillarca granosa TaxID=220873 RepID=A0ABQ9FKU3_TEGGR|nr:hypothetical protein KUTeg_004789 [Tegillarca granosa]
MGVYIYGTNKILTHKNIIYHHNHKEFFNTTRNLDILKNSKLHFFTRTKKKNKKNRIGTAISDIII